MQFVTPTETMDMAINIETPTQAPNKQRLFALCGVVAPILFTLVVIAAGLLRPGYSQTQNFISDLGVGSYAVIQNANFVVFGVAIDRLRVSASRRLARFATKGP